MLGSNGSTTVAAALNKSLPYDVRTDFVAVAPVGINPMLLVVRPDLPAKDVEGLLAAGASQARQAERRIGRRGRRRASGARALQVTWASSTSCTCPTEGGGPAMADLMASLNDIYFGGHVDGFAAREDGQAARARPDRQRTFGRRRPTFRPSPKRDCPATRPPSPTASSCRRRAAPQLTTRLHAAVDATIRSPDIARKFADLGADPQFGSPQEFAKPTSPTISPNGPASQRTRASRPNDYFTDENAVG
jgi:tripartite-type tricarboxylate transporter receptor subunit TctC